ncbi:MAG: S8 family serine peptidase [Alphaproteobacteria bacterium]|nr:S8 family serine peptidase [Alphaproteobacteria bacterium]
MNVKNRMLLILTIVLVGNGLFPQKGLARSFDAVEIYRQARYKNYNFLHHLSQYNRVIDVQNRFGDTAYCIALRYNDEEAAELLVAYGANKTHACINKIKREQTRNAEHLRASKLAGRYPERPVQPPVVSEGNNYLWWGVGALALGGGIAALASSGGGGGGSKHSDNNSGNDTPGGNQGGDNPGGNQGGDNPGGNQGGDNPGGNQGGDNPGGNQGGDNPGGNQGGDNPGGNQGGDNPGGIGDGLTNVSATSFKTAEYDKGNFLAGINAAEAYSYIYKKDKNGNLVSHQAASDNALKKIKVGVIDTGVFNHRNLEGKIKGGFDANAYNSSGNARGYINGNNHYYILEKGGKYYFLAVNMASMNGTPVDNLTKDGLKNVLQSYNLSLDDFTVMNGAGGGAPGSSDTSDFKVDDPNSWLEAATGLSHGTHVAGIIAGNKNDEGMHGVAFENAEIYAGSWDLIQKLTDMTKYMLNNGVSVFNNSWGYPVSENINAAKANWLYTHDNAAVLPAYAEVAKNKGVWVQATGNEGQHEAAVHAGMGGLDMKKYGYNGAGKYEVPFLAVTALDGSTATYDAPSGQIADYANWCGSASGYCLAAPGTGVLSTSAVKDSFMPMDGTSMATPVVTGSIALLNGYYPWLSSQHIAWLLLETANDKGAYADKNIYGQGVLDLEAAITTPAGELSLASDETFDSLQAARTSRLSLSGPLQKKLEKIMPQKIMAFDELKRPFAYDTAQLVNKTHGANANFRNKVSRMATGGVKKTIKDEKTGFAFSSSDYYNKGGKAQLANAEVLSESENGSSRFYYSENSKYSDNDNVLGSSSNPYFAMNEAYGAEQVLNLNDTSKLKLMLQTGENGLYERDYEQDRVSFDERSYALGAEYAFKLTDYLELATTGGMLFEDNALLGMNGAGGFNIKDGSTYYMGLKAALNLTNKLSLLAAYYRGYTQGAETAMLSVSDLETESLNAALEYRLNANDKVGISFGSPLSVVKGRAALRYATGRDNYSDTVHLERLSSSLKPEAKEYDLGVYYQGQPKEDLSLMGKVEARFNADGEKGVTDYLGIVGVSAAF